MTQIVFAHPPMWEEISAAFPFATSLRNVIFSWGPRIYNPNNVRLGAHLIAHEAVHARRQGDVDKDIREWWRRYIDDRQFRLDEEIPAHIAEMRSLLAGHTTRANHRSIIASLATRLSSPLYGSLLSSTTVRVLLRIELERRGSVIDGELHRKQERIERLPDGRVRVQEKKQQ